jgi:hypothetical protein
LTEHTVKNYLFRIFDKLGVSSRVEVVLYAFRFRKDLIGSAVSSVLSAQSAKSYAGAQTMKGRALATVAAKKALENIPDAGRRARA